jgi:glycosyltransferase involved in cell wall biosynthesis
MRFKAPYTVAFVLSSFIRGGMETRLADFVREADKSRWDPHIFAIYDRDLISHTVEASRLHTPFSSGKTDFRPSFRLAKAFREHNAAIVWTMTQGISAGWGRLAALMARAPIRVLSIHGNEPLAPITLLLNPWTDAIVANSQHVANVFRSQGIPEQKIHVIYNGIDSTLYAPGEDRRAELLSIPADRPMILNVGRLFHEKGRDVMLRAAVPLMQNPNPPLIVFAGEGAGSQRAKLETLATELGIAENVRFLGIRNDVPDLLRACDVVVMSSRDVPFGESCPNVVLEGMATGKPVVATRVGGTAELLEDRVTGFLVPPDDAAALSAQLQVLLGHPDLRQKMGVAGRQRAVQDFPLRQMVAAREQLLEELLHRKKLID